MKKYNIEGNPYRLPEDEKKEEVSQTRELLAIAIGVAYPLINMILFKNVLEKCGANLGQIPIWYIVVLFTNLTISIAGITHFIVHAKVSNKIKENSNKRTYKFK